MRIKGAIIPILLAGSALAEEPLSAIEWMKKAPQIVAAKPAPAAPSVNEPPVTTEQSVEITAEPLGAAPASGIGLLPSSVTGLPQNLWSGSRAEDLKRLLEEADVDNLPAMQALLVTLIVTEADPLISDSENLTLSVARLDRLMDLGAVDAILALLDQVDKSATDFMRLWFDASLLLDEMDKPCAQIVANPASTPSLEAQIFCTARMGDWETATTLLTGGIAVGTINTQMGRLLTAFLDHDQAEEIASTIVPTAAPSPLEYRLFEAIGEPLSAAPLPRAISVAELSGNSGWKAQIEAAERLVRAGGLSENQLIAAYSDRKSAASGGVWDRVTAVQAFEAQLENSDDIGPELERAWSLMRAAQLQVPFARLYAEQLLKRSATSEDAPLIQTIGYLSPYYETAAAYRPAQTPQDELLAAIAQGLPDKIQAVDATTEAIKNALSSQTVPSDYAELIAQNRLGEAILNAIHDISQGAKGDARALEVGLSFLHRVGLSDVARRASLQILLLK